MGSSTTITMEGLAKELYPVDKIAELEQQEVTAWKKIQEDNDVEYSAITDGGGSEGGSFKFAVKANDAHGYRMTTESSNLPTAQSAEIVQGRAKVKEFVGVLQFTKRELELASKSYSSAKGFSDVKTLQMESLISSSGKYFNRQIVRGEGDDTITAITTTEGVATATLEVDDATNFLIGQPIDIIDSTFTTYRVQEALIVDVDVVSAQHTITIDSSITVTATDVIGISGIFDNNSSDGVEMTSFLMAYDDGTLNADFQGITRSGAGEVPLYRGLTLDASGNPLSYTYINSLMSRAHRLLGVDFMKVKDCYWLMSPEQWKVYASQSIPQIQFMPTDSGDMNQNYDKKFIAGKMVELDTDMRRSDVFLNTPDVLKKTIVSKLDWESDLGGSTLKWVNNTTQGILVLYSLLQAFSRNPRRGIALSNLKTTGEAAI